MTVYKLWMRREYRNRMIRIARKYLNWFAVTIAVICLCIQVASDLYLPTVTSDLINKGVLQQDFNYIWHQGSIMLLVAFIGLLGSAVNVYFASTQSMKVGQKLRQDIFKHVLTFPVRKWVTLGIHLWSPGPRTTWFKFKTSWCKCFGWC